MTQYIYYIKVFQTLGHITDKIIVFDVLSELLESNNIQYLESYTKYETISDSCESLILQHKFKENSVVLYCKVDTNMNQYGIDLYYCLIINYDGFDGLMNIFERTLKLKAFL